VKSIRNNLFHNVKKSFHVSYSLIYNLNPTQDLLRLMGKFLIHENVPARGACNVVDNPREGEVIQPFKKGHLQQELHPGSQLLRKQQEATPGSQSLGDRCVKFISALYICGTNFVTA